MQVGKDFAHQQIFFQTVSLFGNVCLKTSANAPFHDEGSRKRTGVISLSFNASKMLFITSYGL
jgi:hypothetical protein